MEKYRRHEIAIKLNTLQIKQVGITNFLNNLLVTLDLIDNGDLLTYIRYDTHRFKTPKMTSKATEASLHLQKNQIVLRITKQS